MLSDLPPSSNTSFIGGGNSNISSAGGSTISGGYSNTASGALSFIGGGTTNTASTSHSAILGGTTNTTSTFACAMIVGSNITANRVCTTFVNDLTIVSAAACSGCGVCVSTNGLLVPYTAGGGGANTPIKLGSGQVYSNIPIGVNSSTVALSANTIYLAPFIPAQTFTISNFLINVAALGAGNYRILLYSHSNTNGLPDVLLYESTDLSVTTIGVKTATTTQTFIAGTTYWLGVYGSVAAQFVAVTVASQNQIGMDSTLAQYTSILRNTTFGSAPNPFGTTYTISASSFLRIGLTVA